MPPKRIADPTTDAIASDTFQPNSALTATEAATVDAERNRISTQFIDLLYASGPSNLNEELRIGREAASKGLLDTALVTADGSMALHEWSRYRETVGTMLSSRRTDSNP